MATAVPRRLLRVTLVRAVVNSLEQSWAVRGINEVDAGVLLFGRAIDQRFRVRLRAISGGSGGSTEPPPSRRAPTLPGDGDGDDDDNGGEGSSSGRTRKKKKKKKRRTEFYTIRDAPEGLNLANVEVGVGVVELAANDCMSRLALVVCCAVCHSPPFCFPVLSRSLSPSSKGFGAGG